MTSTQNSLRAESASGQRGRGPSLLVRALINSTLGEWIAAALIIFGGVFGAPMMALIFGQ